MAAHEILTSPHPTLRDRATKVKALTPKLEQLIEDMIATMRASSGVGLAAPQIGVNQRVIVVEYGEGIEDPDAPSKPPKLYVVINPEIVRHSRETVTGNEACLSLPGYFGEVDRYESVTVKGLNRQGKPFKLKATGWLARIFQHEIDHVQGMLYIDRATEVWRIEEDEEGEGPTVV
jgi:peptide deformylase